MSSAQSRPSAVNFPVVSDGSYAAIRLAPNVKADYERLWKSNDTLSKQQRTHLKRYFERFAALGPSSLNEEKFKFEDSYPDGRGGQVSVFAFKPFKMRVYGGILGVAGKRCFVGVRVDLSKKQDKADQGLLRSAAADIAALLEYKA
jgi:hypothetical protein